jgi:MoaA/NifB/PqqE/SkfB family radical SAM enzyme
VGSDRVDQGLRERVGFVASAGLNQLAVWSDFHLRTSLSRPFMVFIEPTLRCPMACKFCDLPTDRTFPRRDELPLERWKQILSELREFSPSIRSVYISGGEPFFRRDMIDLIEHAHSIGMATRTLTIGWFCDERLCDRLLRSPMEFLKFSIHSSRPEVHDQLVGRQVHERAVGAIRYLKRNGYEGRIGMLCTVFEGNVDHLHEVPEFAADLGIDYVLFRPLFGQTVADRVRDQLPTDPHEFNPDCVVRGVDRIRDAVEKLKVLRRQGLPVANDDHQLDLIVAQAEGTYHGYRGCHLMYESMYIKPNGNVDVCGHLALGVMGNLREEPVGEVLGSKRAYAARHAVTRSCSCPANGFIRKSFQQKVALVREILS